jgi:hypothetical protein
MHGYTEYSKNSYVGSQKSAMRLMFLSLQSKDKSTYDTDVTIF